MPITIVKDKNGKPIKKDGLQKYRVRVSYTVYGADGSPKYKEVERTAYGKTQAQELEEVLLAAAADAGKLRCRIGTTGLFILIQFTPLRRNAHRGQRPMSASVRQKHRS